MGGMGEDLHPYLLHLVSDVGEIHDEIKAHNAVNNFDIFVKIRSVKAVLFLQAVMKLHSRVNSTKSMAFLR